MRRLTMAVGRERERIPEAHRGVIGGDAHPCKSASGPALRFVRHSLGLKASRGWGWLTNPRRAAYNRVHSRTTKGCAVVAVVGLIGAAQVGAAPIG